MKLISLIFLMCCFSQPTAAQVSGKLITADSLPLPFANVSMLKSADTSLLQATLSNEQGLYRFENIPAGIYLIRVSSIGFQAWHSAVFEISANQEKSDARIIIMQQEKKELGEVVVRAQRNLFQQKPEGLVVNVENSLLTKGSSALQVLERSPGVTINYRDNSLALNGKNGVMVMLNGKLMRIPMEQLVAMLNSMSADDIATIELLTTPPAKYDAEGSAGLINIVLKKNKKLGTSGAISLTGGYGKAEKAMANINLAHNTRTLNIYGAYSFSRNRTYTDMFVASEQHMPFLGGDVAATGWFNSSFFSSSHDASLGLDAKLNSKITVGANLNYNRAHMQGTAFTDAGYTILPDSLLQFTGINRGGNTWNNIIGSVYLEKAIKEGENLNISADWLHFDFNDAYQVQSSFTNKHGMQAGNNQSMFSPAQRGKSNTGIAVGVAKLDYTKQLNKKLKFETGLKGSFTGSASLSGIESLLNNVWTGSEQTSSNIKMKEGIGAVYASFTAQAGKSVNLAVGLRYEYSATSMNNGTTGANIVHRKRGVLFPSVFLTKKINDHSELQVSYTKRISRPSYKDLASYVGYSDPTAAYTGNPFLQPTITNNIKLGYNYKGYMMSLLFSRDENAIARYQLTESPGRDILYISPQNLYWQNNITLQTSIPVTISRWWSMTYSFAGGPRQYKAGYTKKVLEHTYFGYSLNSSQVFKFPKSFSVEVSGWYNNTVYNGTQMVAGFGVLNAGIKKELKNSGGSFQLTVSDILMDQKYRIRYGTLTEEAFNIKNYVSVNTESSMFPVIKLTYTRSFGGGIKEQSKPKSGLQDEKNRVNN